MAYGAPVAYVPQVDVFAQLPKYFAAVLAGAWARRVAALSTWVQLHDAADEVPSLAAGVIPAASRGAVAVCVSCELGSSSTRS